MNINDYIKKYSQVEIDKENGIVTVYMSVPLAKIVEYAHQENDETQPMAVFQSDIKRYLTEVKKLKASDAASNDSITNQHPKGLTAKWIFNIEVAKASKTNKPKRTKKSSKTTKEV